MAIGKAIRMSRLLKNNRMLCIPLDHGITNGPIRGIENAHKIIYDSENAGLTCIIVNKGIIKTFPRPPKLGIIAHMSSSTSLGPAPNRKVIMGSIEEAIRLGADAVSVHINIGCKEEPEMLHDLGMISDKSTEWNIPLIAMMYPRGENIKNPHDETIVSHVARIGAEAGADIVKTVYTGDPKSFSRVVKRCPVPIVIAGGPKTSTDSELLTMCAGAIEAGAIGVTFGRNIFQHKNPRGILNALSKIIFEGRKLNGVLKGLGESTSK